MKSTIYPEAKFEIGQTIYACNSFQIGRYVLAGIIKEETENGIVVKYTTTRPDGRKEDWAKEEFESNFYATLDEVKELAQQSLDAVFNNAKKEIAEFTDEKFDKILAEKKAALEAKKQAQKNA